MELNSKHRKELETKIALRIAPVILFIFKPIFKFLFRLHLLNPNKFIKRN